MPIYEFSCTNCGQKVEQLCKMGDNGAELVCPYCGSKGLSRLVSGFAAPGVKGNKCAGCSGGNCSNC